MNWRWDRGIWQLRSESLLLHDSLSILLPRPRPRHHPSHPVILRLRNLACICSSDRLCKTQYITAYYGLRFTDIRCLCVYTTRESAASRPSQNSHPQCTSATYLAISYGYGLWPARSSKMFLSVNKLSYITRELYLFITYSFSNFIASHYNRSVMHVIKRM